MVSFWGLDSVRSIRFTPPLMTLFLLVIGFQNCAKKTDPNVYRESSPATTNPPNPNNDPRGISGTAPSLIGNPSLVTALEGSALQMQVLAIGTLPIVFEWKKDGVALPAYTTGVFNKSLAMLSDAGTYTVKAINSFGQTQPVSIVVSVTPTMVSIPNPNPNPNPPPPIVVQTPTLLSATTVAAFIPNTFQGSTYSLKFVATTDGNGNTLKVDAPNPGATNSVSLQLSVSPRNSSDTIRYKWYFKSTRTTLDCSAITESSPGVVLLSATAPSYNLSLTNPNQLGCYRAVVDANRNGVSSPSFGVSILVYDPCDYGIPGLCPYVNIDLGGVGAT